VSRDDTKCHCMCPQDDTSYQSIMQDIKACVLQYITMVYYEYTK